MSISIGTWSALHIPGDQNETHGEPAQRVQVPHRNGVMPACNLGTFSYLGYSSCPIQYK